MSFALLHVVEQMFVAQHVLLQVVFCTILCRTHILGQKNLGSQTLAALHIGTQMAQLLVKNSLLPETVPSSQELNHQLASKPSFKANTNVGPAILKS